MSEVTLLRHAYEGDLLLLRTFCRVGQQESPVHAGARRPHRLGIVKIALDELDVRQSIGLGFPQIARDRARLNAAGGQSFDDFAAHRSGGSSDQNHGGFLLSAPLGSSVEHDTI
jgi:hypothetical protein